jgi:hypothetical protein
MVEQSVAILCGYLLGQLRELSTRHSLDRAMMQKLAAGNRYFQQAFCV